MRDVYVLRGQCRAGVTESREQGRSRGRGGVPGDDLGKVDEGLPGKQGGLNEHFNLQLFPNHLQNGKRGFQKPYTHEGQGNI